MSNKQKSGILTAVVMMLIALVLLSFGYDPPDPPIPEEGVEVNVGDSDFGQGDNPQPANQTTSYAPPAAQNQVATQHTEPSVSMPSTPNQGNVTNPVPLEQTQPETREPEINQNALFTGRRNQGSGSQGQSTGTGDQGRPNGTQTSSNYTGNGGGQGSYSLAGRSAVSIPRPSYNSNIQGKVVVKIVVDQQGRVIRAEAPAQGSTIANGTLVEQARQAALKAKFNPSADAPEEQSGTITYIFTI